MKILLLHAYSALNKGDGLLVIESLALLEEALPGKHDFLLAASRPESFGAFDGTVLTTSPRMARSAHPYFLIPAWRASPDLIVAVGGGYLRGGTCTELLKMLVVHGPQLLFARVSRAPVIYLPQSVGPLPGSVAAVVKALLRRAELVLVRDQRSLALLRAAKRAPDLALLRTSPPCPPHTDVAATPVLTVRSVARGGNALLRVLAGALQPFDGFVQSSTGGNDDREFMRSLGPQVLLTDAELMRADGTRRVVVAVRLHAALMALAAGHFVIHLAYERKGYGAFDDLELRDYVHSVFDADPSLVIAQVNSLLQDETSRQAYDHRVSRARIRLAAQRKEVLSVLSALPRAQADPAVGLC